MPPPTTSSKKAPKNPPATLNSTDVRPSPKPGSAYSGRLVRNIPNPSNAKAAAVYTATGGKIASVVSSLAFHRYPSRLNTPIPATSNDNDHAQSHSLARGNAASARPRAPNASALYGDMRPGIALKAFVLSRNSSSSMPKFQPNAYWPRVHSPRVATASASTSARNLSRDDRRPPRMNRAEPERTSATAVLAFISTAPGRTLFSDGICQIHPAKRTKPSRAVRPAATRGIEDIAVPLSIGRASVVPASTRAERSAPRGL